MNCAARHRHRRRQRAPAPTSGTAPRASGTPVRIGSATRAMPCGSRMIKVASDFTHSPPRLARTGRRAVADWPPTNSCLDAATRLAADLRRALRRCQQVRPPGGECGLVVGHDVIAPATGAYAFQRLRSADHGLAHRHGLEHLVLHAAGNLQRHDTQRRAATYARTSSTKPVTSMPGRWPAAARRRSASNRR